MACTNYTILSLGYAQIKPERLVTSYIHHNTGVTVSEDIPCVNTWIKPLHESFTIIMTGQVGGKRHRNAPPLPPT